MIMTPAVITIAPSHDIQETASCKTKFDAIKAKTKLKPTKG